MAELVLVHIVGPDATGLIAAVAGRLYDLGVNLGDTSFAVLGEAAKLTAVCELPEGMSADGLEGELRSLPPLAAATLSISPFAYRPARGDQARITHHIEITGDDVPGLVAQLAEVLGEFGANIVTLNSERVPSPGGVRYVSRLAVWLPEDKAEACLASIANTAEQLSLSCWSKAI